MLKYLSIISILFFHLPSFSLSLNEAFEFAKKQNSKYLNTSIDTEIAKRQKSLAYAGLAPNLSFRQDSSWQDPAGNNKIKDELIQNKRIFLQQALFQGGAEYQAIKISNNNIARIKATFNNAGLNLYASIAQSYLDLMAVDQEIKTLDEQYKLLEKRVRLLQQRAKIGRSKPSDVVAAQSQMARIYAELVKTRSNRQLTVANLKSLTGLEQIGPLSIPFDIDSMQATKFKLEQVLDAPLIKEKEFEIALAKNYISTARSEFLPSVDLTGNYFLQRDGLRNIVINDKEDWELNINLTWELFSGRSTVHKARIEKLNLLKTEVSLNDLKQQQGKHFQALTERLDLQKQTLNAMSKAEQLAKKHYQQLQKEYAQGLITNLDVLQSLNEYLAIKRMFERENYSLQMAWIEIHLLAGKIP